MRLVRITADDDAAIAAAAAIIEAARPFDDPEAFPLPVEVLAGDIAYGDNLQPDQYYLGFAPGRDEPVALAQVGMPIRDNRHLAYFDLYLHPEHRSTEQQVDLLDSALAIAREAGRTTAWLWKAADDIVGQEFLTQRGFRYASHDARRWQVLADVDRAEVERLADQARAKANAYEVVRRVPPLDEAALAELVAVSAAINDAPMGELTFENEVFDLERLQKTQVALAKRGFRTYRVAARHRETGQLGGHSEVFVHPSQPRLGHQGDTAVAREHRGHRLGLLLKIAMMSWLAETEPQLEVIETWNNADNSYMISVNEALGYRLSRVFHTYEMDIGWA